MSTDIDELLVAEASVPKESEPPKSDSKEPPIWVVRKYVPIAFLHAVLNRLADKGYQVRDIIKTAVTPEYLSFLAQHSPKELRILREGDECYHVIAFDGGRIMKKQAEDMQAQMAAIMGTMPTPGGVTSR